MHAQDRAASGCRRGAGAAVTRALTVWWEGAVVGSLALDRDGQMQFTYAEEWLARDRSPALSWSLPKRREPFRRRLCRPGSTAGATAGKYRTTAAVRETFQTGRPPNLVAEWMR